VGATTMAGHLQLSVVSSVYPTSLSFFGSYNVAGGALLSETLLRVYKLFTPSILVYGKKM
jgi:hypothetical protein